MTKKQAIKVLTEHNEGRLPISKAANIMKIKAALEVCHRLLSKPAKRRAK